MAKVRLGDIATVVTKGTTPTTIGFQFEDSGINFVKIESISEDGTFLKEKFSHISDECNVQMRRSQLQENDILFSIAGAIGRSAIVTKEILPANTNQALAIIRVPKGKIDYNYLLYALSSSAINQQATQHQQGVAQLNISLKNVSDFLLPIYTEAMQKRIVHNLKKIDKLIFLRKQQLEKLDELVKARFVEMFGDEQAFNKEPLSKNVEEMFIGPFGSSLKNENFVSKENGYCMVYEQKHAIRKTMDVETRYIDKTKYEELKRFSIHGGDIIVSCRGTIGETYIVPLNAPLGIMHPSIMKIRVKDSIYNRVFFDFLLQEKLKQHEAQANGSGVKMAVTASALGKEEFIVPSIPLQNQFAAFVERVDQQKQTVQKSLEKLELMKKALMQEYFG